MADPWKLWSEAESVLGDGKNSPGRGHDSPSSVFATDPWMVRSSTMSNISTSTNQSMLYSPRGSMNDGKSSPLMTMPGLSATARSATARVPSTVVTKSSPLNRKRRSLKSLSGAAGSPYISSLVTCREGTSSDGDVVDLQSLSLSAKLDVRSHSTSPRATTVTTAGATAQPSKASLHQAGTGTMGKARNSSSRRSSKRASNNANADAKVEHAGRAERGGNRTYPTPSSPSTSPVSSMEELANRLSPAQAATTTKSKSTTLSLRSGSLDYKKKLKRHTTSASVDGVKAEPDSFMSLLFKRRSVSGYDVNVGKSRSVSVCSPEATPCTTPSKTPQRVPSPRAPAAPAAGSGIGVAWSTLLKHRSMSDLQGDASFMEAVQLFNTKPHAGLERLLALRLVDRTPVAVAAFLHDFPPVDRRALGQYVSAGDDEFADAVLAEYIKLFNFRFLDFDVALRRLLYAFRLPGEAQRIDRILRKFALHFYEANKSLCFNDSVAVYMLAFSTMMLNTDAHNPNVRFKMTKSDFIRNNQGINSGADLPTGFLEDLYARIQTDEIVDTMEKAKFPYAVKKGWLNCLQPGLLNQWKRRWCVLNTSSLMLFKQMDDTVPAFTLSLRNVLTTPLSHQEAGRRHCMALHPTLHQQGGRERGKEGLPAGTASPLSEPTPRRMEITEGRNASGAQRQRVVLGLANEAEVFLWMSAIAVHTHFDDHPATPAGALSDSMEPPALAASYAGPRATSEHTVLQRSRSQDNHVVQ